MDITVTIGIIAALVLAFASIPGGVVLFRGSKRVGWRALAMSAVAGGAGVQVVFAMLLTVRSEGQAPEPVIVGQVVSTQQADPPTTLQDPGSPTSSGTMIPGAPSSDASTNLQEPSSVTSSGPMNPGLPGTDAPTTLQEPSSPTSSGMMLPRPRSAEELASAAHVSIIVLGTIDSVLGEKMVGPYGDDGRPVPGEDAAMPFTDYEVRIESVLKDDGTVTDRGTLVLRMFGHLSNDAAVITPNVFTLPSAGDHLMFALGRNPDGTYGTGPEGLLNVDGEKVTYADGAPLAADVSSEQFIYDVTEWGVATATVLQEALGQERATHRYGFS